MHYDLYTYLVTGMVTEMYDHNINSSISPKRFVIIKPNNPI